MLKLSQFSAGLILALALVWGCGKGSGSAASSGYVPNKAETAAKGGSVSSAKAMDLLPLKVGNTWSYEVQSETTMLGQRNTAPKSVITFTVTAAKTNEDGSTEAEMQVSNDSDQISEVQKWIANKDGVFMQSSGKPGTAVSFTPMQPFIKFPLEKGKEFTWDGHGPVPTGDGKDGHDYKGVLTYKGETSADAVTEAFNCAQMEQSQEWHLSDENLKALNGGNMPKLPNAPSNSKPADPNKPNSGTTPASPSDSKDVKASDLEVDPTTGLSVSTIYFSPGTGIVRFRQEMRVSDKLIVVQVFKLKSKKLS